MNELTIQSRAESSGCLLTLKIRRLYIEETRLLYDIFTTAIVDFFQINGGKFKDIRAAECLCIVDFY